MGRVERHLMASGVSWTCLRPGYSMQNLLTVHRAEIRDRGEIVVPAGRGRTAFVDTRDVAEVAVAALTRPGHSGRAYELTGTTAATSTKVAAVLTEMLDHPVRYTAPSAFASVREQRRRGVATPLLLVTLVPCTTARLGLASRVTGELAALLARPPHDLRTSVMDHMAAWNRTPPDSRSHPAPSTTAFATLLERDGAVSGAARPLARTRPGRRAAGRR